jgi:6-phosphogluconolactonase
MHRNNSNKIASIEILKRPPKLWVCLLLLLGFFAGCGPSTNAGNPATSNSTAVTNSAPLVPTSETNPVPAINTLNPRCGAVGGPVFTLGVYGSNFVASSVVQWNGSARPTKFLNRDSVAAQIAASDIAAGGTPTVTVFNPAPGGGSSNPATFTIGTGGVGPQSITVDPTGKFAYVASNGCPSTFPGTVSMYTINATSGALTLIGRVAAGISTTSVAVDSSGKFGYVTNDGGFGPIPNNGASVSVYTIDGTTGALTPAGAVRANCPAEPCLADSVAVYPSGKFAYVTESYPEDVSMFTVDPNTGALTFVGSIGTVSPHASNSTEIAIDPSGKFAYVVGDGCALDTFNGSISMYTINSITGALSLTGSMPTGVCSSSVTVDPFGRFAYLTNDSGLNGHQYDNVAMYAISASTGALTFTGYAETGMGPSFLAVDPTDKFAYVANWLSNDVSMYTVDGTTGALISMGVIAAGTGPVAVVVHPTGKFAYVANSGTNDVSMYSIDATTGALTLIGTVGT